MKIPVLLEPIEGERYRASNGHPFGCSAEGASPFEAVKKLEQMIEARVKAGAVIVHLDVPLHENEGAAYSGCLPKDDPIVQEWLEIMAENRRKADENYDLP